MYVPQSRSILQRGKKTIGPEANTVCPEVTIRFDFRPQALTEAYDRKSSATGH
jgi:hypothetical protein